MTQEEKSFMPPLFVDEIEKSSEEILNATQNYQQQVEKLYSQLPNMEDLDPVEEAAGIRELMTRCDLTQEQAARKLGKSRSAVTNSLRLLALPEDVRRMVSGGKLSFGHAKVLLGLPNEDLMRQAAAEVAAQNLNVRQTEALCKKLTKPARPPKAKDDNFTRPKRAVEVEAALKEVTGSEVHVDYKDGKGSLKIDFYSDDMLQKFVSLLGMYDPEG